MHVQETHWYAHQTVLRFGVSHENTPLKNPLVSSLSATDELKKFFRSVFVKNKNLLKIRLFYHFPILKHGVIFNNRRSQSQ